MCERGIARHRIEFRAGNFERDRSLQFAADDAAQPAPDRSEIAFGRRLDDQPDPITTDAGEIARKRRAPLP
jgi:hypothetical protein